MKSYKTNYNFPKCPKCNGELFIIFNAQTGAPQHLRCVNSACMFIGESYAIWLLKGREEIPNINDVPKVSDD